MEANQNQTLKNNQTIPTTEPMLENTQVTSQGECPITISRLQEIFGIMQANYAQIHRRFRTLEQVQQGELWKAIGAKYPKHQILPDTNWVKYVKANIVASLYTVAKGATLLPKTDKDLQAITEINLVMDNIWAVGQYGYYQFLAGTNAALFNVGYTQVGWGEDNKRPILKNIPAIKFMRDPFTVDIENAAYAVTYDKVHKSVLLKNKNYKDAKTYLDAATNPQVLSYSPEMDSSPGSRSGQDKDYHTLLIYWVFDEEKEDTLYEIHVLDNIHILYWKPIKPAIIPIAELYCDDPGESLVGLSPAGTIFANNVVYNLMDSLCFTAEYKQQNPPKFISNQAQLNLPDFKANGDDPKGAFIVNGDASKAVHYHEYPQISPYLQNNMQRLSYSMQEVTGVDGRYTGRDTGSIITTGGTEEMLNRVTMIDTPKIMYYERYTKKLTKLIMQNMIEFAPPLVYLRKDETKPNHYLKVLVNFPAINSDMISDYEVMISDELPKNKARIAEAANYIMEKQMQYSRSSNTPVELMSPEEWLRCQDIPFKEQMLERMGLQRMDKTVEEISAALTMFSELASQGMSPEDAIAATAQGIMDMRQPQAGPTVEELGFDPAMQGNMGPAQPGASAPNIPMM